MDGIQGQSGVGESQNKAVCLNLLHDTAIDVLFFIFLSLTLIIACADAPFTNLTLAKLLFWRLLWNSA